MTASHDQLLVYFSGGYMFNRSTLSFSLKLGALSGAVWIVVGLFASKGWTVLIAMGLMAAVGAILISKQKVMEFKTRFAMAFGAAWTALILFAIYLIYMRGTSVPVWLHLINIPVTFVFALVGGAVIAAISPP
jgi:hypothetical protein